MRRGARAITSNPRVHQIQSASGAGAGEATPSCRPSSSSRSARTRARLTKSLTTRADPNLRVLLLEADHDGRLRALRSAYAAAGRWVRPPADRGAGFGQSRPTGS